MARVIEFHIPANFQPKKNWTAPENWGKLLQFSAGAVKEPVWRVTEPAREMADVLMFR